MKESAEVFLRSLFRPIVLGFDVNECPPLLLSRSLLLAAWERFLLETSSCERSASDRVFSISYLDAIMFVKDGCLYLRLEARLVFCSSCVLG